jgi:hypothetical protein
MMSLKPFITKLALKVAIAGGLNGSDNTGNPI